MCRTATEWTPSHMGSTLTPPGHWLCLFLLWWLTPAGRSASKPHQFLSAFPNVVQLPKSTSGSIYAASRPQNFSVRWSHIRFTVLSMFTCCVMPSLLLGSQSFVLGPNFTAGFMFNTFIIASRGEDAQTDSLLDWWRHQKELEHILDS